MYLDGGLWQVELCSELTASWSRHVVLLGELSLQARQLFATERRPVATDRAVVRACTSAATRRRCWHTTDTSVTTSPSQLTPRLLLDARQIH